MRICEINKNMTVETVKKYIIELSKLGFYYQERYLTAHTLIKTYYSTREKKTFDVTVDIFPQNQILMIESGLEIPQEVLDVFGLKEKRK